MSFWLGVFAGLTVWKSIMVLLTLAMQGTEVAYGPKEVLIEFAQFVAFATIAWYLATFGGGLA